MTWDATLPLGTEAISNGDDRIRELKTDIQTSLRGNTSEGTEAIFPGSDTANPVFRYRGLKGTTGARPSAGQYGLYFNTTRNVLQRDNGSSWDDIGTMIPATTVCVFFQSAAPTGWTQVNSHNDKIIRVVSGTGGGSGGSTAFTSCWTASTTGAEASHTHLVSGDSGDGNVTGAGALFDAGAIPHRHTISITSGAGSSHSHSVTAYAPQYIDAIICSKD